MAEPGASAEFAGSGARGLAAAFFALARQDVGSQHALSDAATPQEEPALLWGSADSTPDAWDPTTWPRDLFHPNPASLSFRDDSNLTSTAPTRHGGRLPPTGELRTRAQGVASDGACACSSPADDCVVGGVAGASAIGYSLTAHSEASKVPLSCKLYTLAGVGLIIAGATALAKVK